MNHPKIMVDGELRHVNNSNGQPIHDTYEGIHKFHQWFGKSKAVDEHGRPQVYYHGTGTDFDEFSHKFTGSGNDSYGTGFYFAKKPDLANHFAGSHVMPVYLKMEKPIDHKSDKGFTTTQIKNVISRSPNLDDALSNFGDVDYEGRSKVFTSAVNAYNGASKYEAMNMIHNDFFPGHHEEFLDAFKKGTGHDSVSVDDGDIAMIFHPTHIKSAISNSGEFSKKSSKLIESV